MLKSWGKFEDILEKSRLRVVFILLAFAVGITLLFKQNMYLVLSFVIILGFYAVFEGLAPSFLRTVKDLVANFIPNKVVIVIFIIIRICSVIIGLYLIILMIIGFYSYFSPGNHTFCRNDHANTSKPLCNLFELTGVLSRFMKNMLYLKVYMPNTFQFSKEGVVFLF